MPPVVRWRGVAGRLALLVASLALSLGGVEAAFRAFHVLPTHRDSLRGFYDYEPTLGWIGTRDYTARFRHDDFDVVVANDERGFRRAAVAFEGPGNAPRWAFLGDSFTWGWGVAQGEVFTDRLQALLGPRVAIANYGVTAYGTGQERLLLEDVVLLDRPELVAVMFVANDPMDTVYSKKDRRPYFSLEDGGLRLHNRPVSHPLVGPFDRLSQHSVFLSLLRHQLKRLEDRFEVDNRRGSLPQDWPVVSAVLAEMKALAAAADPPAELWVIPVPLVCEITAAPGADARQGACSEAPVREELAAICAEHGIALLDLVGPFAEAWRASPDAGERGEPYYFPHDGHWTARGHELAANVLYEAWRPRAGGDGAVAASR